MDEFKKLAKKWRKRRDKLRIKCEDFYKNKTTANERWGNITYGQFQEVEKCAKELIAFIHSQKKIIETQKLQSNNPTRIVV